MKMNKQFLGRLLRIIVIMVTILAVVLSLLLFTPLLFGLKPFTITSTSMSPVLNKGTIIYVKKVDPSTLKKDDIITYFQTDQDVIVTHRVLKIDREKKLIYTIGDANFTADYIPISFDDVIGVYANYKLPFLELFY